MVNPPVKEVIWLLKLRNINNLKITIMKTYVTVEFKYNSTNYLFYGNTREEVKKKIDNWIKENNITNRPHYTYNDKGVLYSDESDLKQEVRKETKDYLWEHYDTTINIVSKNLVRFGGFIISLIVLSIILYEIRKYMLYPYFLEFVNNHPTDLTDGLNKIMNFGWDVLGIMILFYWQTEIVTTVSLIVGWFTPKFVERYYFNKNLKKMKDYVNTLIII
jgi:hypothetical protein